MDNLTHSLFALTLAQTPLRRAGRGTTLALVLASNAPDSDIVVAIQSGRAAYLAGHRGISHGPLGVLGLAVVSAALAYGVMRWRQRRGTRARPDEATTSGGASFLSLIGVALIGTLGHVLMDLPTPYGTRALSPFVDIWYALDWMPIIDIYLLSILAAGLIVVWARPRWRTRIACTALVLVTANYALRAELHAQALRRALRDSSTVSSSLIAWPDAPSPKLPTDRPCAEPPCAATTAAIPTFGSPFRWRIVREFPGGYRLSDLDLRRYTEDPLGLVPHEGGPLVEAAREAPLARTFLMFSRFPAAQITRDGEHNLVDLRDARFINMPSASQSEDLRGSLFRVIVRLDAGGTIVDDRFGN